jgi:hypothetical protein
MGEESKAADCLREAESRNPGSKAQIQGTLFMRISMLPIIFIGCTLTLFILYIDIPLRSTDSSGLD